MIETRYVGRCDECRERYDDDSIGLDSEQDLIDGLNDGGWLVDLTLMRVYCPSCRIVVAPKDPPLTSVEIASRERGGCVYGEPEHVEVVRDADR